MARHRPSHATLYDFRDLDLMHKIRAETNGVGISSVELADLLGFDSGEGGRQVGIRMAWMRRYGMVAFDDRDRTWKLSRSGERIVDSHLRAPALKVIEELPDESMVEAMALVTSRFQRGETTLGHMLRREFSYATQKARR